MNLNTKTNTSIMKKLFYLAALLLAGGVVTSCSDDDTKEGPAAKPIESVTAVDGSQTRTATINDEARTIDLGLFEELTDLSSVEVTFQLAKGVVMKTPSKPQATVDLVEPLKIEINDGTKDIAYMMTAKLKNIPDPIQAVQVDGRDATCADGVISVVYMDGMNITAVKLDLTLADGAKVVSPEDLTFNLEENDGELIVNYYETDFTYTVKLTDYVDPIIKNGWVDVTADFGALPEYIKIYRTDKAANKDNNIAYIAVMGRQATMGVVGDGASAMKPLTDLEKDGAYNVYLVGVTTTYNQHLVRDGKLFQSGSPRSFGTIGQEKDGSYTMHYAQPFDGKLYTFPFRTGTGAYVPREVTDGTVWEPQTAFSGAPTMIWDGQVLTEGQITLNEQETIWYGTALNARACVGMTNTGKIVLYCSQQVDGSVGTTMTETAQMLKAIGCVTAFSLEGSGSPNLHVNQKKTVTNSKEPNLKAVQAAIAFK